MAPSSDVTVADQAHAKVVTVYAASSANVDDKYKQHAYELGQLIAREGWVQINGGGHTGLMGASTRGALDAAGIVDAVILDKFVDSNLSSGFRSVKVTNDMPSRKAGLSQPADAFIALPGGLGTLDELAEVLCNRQLCFHERPIVIVNTNGFYNSFRTFILDAISAKFVTEAVSRVVCFADTPAEAIQFLKKSPDNPVYIDKDALHSGEMDAASRHVTPHPQ